MTRIVIRRNQSLDRAGFRRVTALVAAPTFFFVALAIAAGWWPILAFCIGVFLTFAAVLYVVMTGAREREVVTVGARHVVIESGRNEPRMRIEFERYWTRVERRSGSRPALALVARGVAVEIAAALAESEQKSLARRLRALIGPTAIETDAADAARSASFRAS
ncbi:MAG: DUF2244 domain-containing protein [Gammaproteobacteria bacterium]